MRCERLRQRSAPARSARIDGSRATDPSKRPYGGPRRVRQMRAAVWTASLGFAIALPATAQEPMSDRLLRVSTDPAVVRALEMVERSEERAVATLIELASIVSPSGGEHLRAAAVARRMREIGLAHVVVDNTPNVIGVIPGTSDRALVFVAMLDDLPITGILQREALQRGDGTVHQREGDRLLGPATELQSLVAAMLVAAEALASAGVRPRHDLVFAGIAREETELRGMEVLYRQLESRAIGFIEVFGDGREIQYGAGGAISWWRVVARGPRSHTREGGLPNVNHAIARAVSEIFALPHPERYRDRGTALNVGVLRSGEVFNRKPASGWFSLDIRSREPSIVEEIVHAIAGTLEHVEVETGIALDLVPQWQTLGGQIPGARDSFLTQAAAAVSRHLGYEPVLSDQGCCNMRVPVSYGTLAISVRGERGGERHTLNEWGSIPGMINAARHIVLLAATAGDLR